MDFQVTEGQQAVRTLAAELFADRCAPEHLRTVEDTSPGFDRSLWSELAKAGLLGVAVPEDDGGLGLGVLELALLLEEAGRAVAPVPLLGHTVASAVLARHGGPLAGLADGTTVATVALSEPLGDELDPATTATSSADGWLLSGTKTCVPGGTYAGLVLVSASTPDGPRLFALDPSSAGVTVEAQQTISWVPEALLLLDGARGTLVGDASTVVDAVQLGQVATCALLAGIAQQAVRLTADYTKTREQFDHPIAHFQAVTQRIGDSFIDTTAMRLTMLQAAWRLGAGLDAAKEVAVAKYFAAEAGQRVVRAATHLHGGMGVSREYPLHRYYLGAKQLELTLGSGTRQLVRLGRLLADEPV